jgi:nitronate monooxygenase
MKIATAFSERLGLRLPLIQAPMAGGPSSLELVIAASSAGALGSFGFAYTQPEEMERQAAALRATTERPFGINLFVAPLPGPIDAGAQRAAMDAVARYYRELDLPAPEPVKPPFAPQLEAQLETLKDIRPAVFTVHLGSIDPRPYKALGMLVGGSANCVAEAKRLEELGYDFVIAQGGEAGGHRGSYLRDPYTSLTGTLALTRLLVRAVKLPVVAAGGIMDGAGIAAALALGAQAAQLGTAFIPCPESGAAPAHKDAILAAREDDTRITEKFSGKPARGLANRLMREMAEAAQLAFPAQNQLTGKLRLAAAKAGKADYLALWAGQAAPLARRLPAAELIEALERETIAVLRSGATLIKE